MSNLDLLSLIQGKVRSLKAYQVENIDCAVKLHANENPFQLPEEFLSGFSESLKKLLASKSQCSSSGKLQGLSPRPRAMILYIAKVGSGKQMESPSLQKI